MTDTARLFDLFLERSREIRNTGQRYDRWRASSLGYCMRRQFFERLGVPKLRELDAKTLRTFHHGDVIHSIVKKTWYRAGLVLEEEGELEDDELQFRGHYDLLVGGPVNHEVPDEVRERWSPEWAAMVAAFREEVEALIGSEPMVPTILEVKSMNSRAIERAYKEGARDYHQKQLGAYFLMGKRHPEQFPVPPVAGALVYVGKDSFGTLTIPMKGAWVDAAEAELRSLNDYWANGALPPCTCAGWMVGYCAYSETTKRCCSVDLLALLDPADLPEHFRGAA